MEAGWIETFRDEIAVAGSNSSSKLKVIDIKDKTAPKVIDSIALGADWLVHGLSKAGDHLGLQLADVSVPEKPVFLGRIDKLGSAFDGVTRFAWHGNLVYTQDSAKGMALVDVSDPSKPVKVGSLHSRLWEAGAAYQPIIFSDDCYRFPICYRLTRIVPGAPEISWSFREPIPPLFHHRNGRLNAD